MAFDLIILGCASATPTSVRYTTSQLLSMREQLFLIDCGEGTQQQLRRNKVKLSRIHHIFISHMHGDHYFGLIGLISSLHLLGRKKPLHLYGPPPLWEVVRLQLKVSKTWLEFPLEFHPTTNEGPELLWEDDKLEVHSFPLKHRIATTGFRFIEKPGLRKLIPAKLAEYRIPEYDRRNLQLGKDWTDSKGVIVPNAELTHDPEPPLSYAFCSDTAYHEPVAEFVRGSDLLYHEATFTEEHRTLAGETRHSTASDAAKIARSAGVGKLILGHFSSRYDNLNVHLSEAAEYFPEVMTARENLRIHVDHSGVHVVEE